MKTESYDKKKEHFLVLVLHFSGQNGPLNQGQFL